MKTAEDNREKPDWEKLSEKLVELTECDDQQTSVYQDGVIAGAEKIWNDYVTPLQSRIKELEDQQRWIPVNERLPEPSVQYDSKGTNQKFNKVQIYSPSTIGVDTGHYWGTDANGPMKGWSIMGVTHWQPLPTPPPL